MTDDQPPRRYKDLPGPQRIAAGMAAAQERDQEIVDGLPLRACHSTEDVYRLLGYLAASIRDLDPIERDALLYATYLQHLVRSGVVEVPDEQVYRDALLARVKAGVPGDDDGD